MIYLDISSVTNISTTTNTTIISAFGVNLNELSSVGLPLAILIIVEIGLIYFLTYEFFIKELFVAYGNLAFTIVWTLLPAYIGPLSLFSEVLVLLYIGFIAVSVFLLLYPILTYFNKRRYFKIIKDKYSRLRADYETVSKSYKEINDKITKRNNTTN